MKAASSLFLLIGLTAGCAEDVEERPPPPPPTPQLDQALVAQGKDIFRFDTFGDESFWTGALKMNEVISTAVDPTTALSVGLKVDAEALPAEVVAGIQD